MPNQVFTGVGWHAFNVPNDVKQITVELDGAGSPSQPGGRVVGTLLVNDGQTVQCFVGGEGGPNSGSTGGDGGSGGGGKGGDGHSGRPGGDGGGGASYIRINTHDGTIKAVAGGGGGDSGDSGDGGEGGGDVGEGGHPGTAGPNTTSNATGGTQNQGGNGGTSSAGGQYDGNNASDAKLGGGANGGVANAGVDCHGGGGGGAGYHGGGGGQASAPGYAPGGGGAGGSNYDGGLTSVSVNSQGTGGLGNGRVELTWVAPVPHNQPPTAPSQVKLNGEDATDGMATRIKGSPTVSAVVNDPDNTDTIRLVVRWSTSSNMANYKQVVSDTSKPYTEGGKRDEVRIGPLTQNTRYWVRVYGQDNHGLLSVNYTSFNFWTNQTALPDSLRVNGGNAGITINTIDSATFSWDFNDPDAGDLQQGFKLQYRRTATATTPVGAWTLVDKPNTADNTSPVTGPPARSRNQWVFNPNTFKGNTFYEWQVRTRDLQGLWSGWSGMFRFFAASTSSPPIGTNPTKGEAVDVTGAVTFAWQFRDVDPGDSQTKADIRWRLNGQDDTAWITTLGSVTEPGAEETWTIPAGNFAVGYNYEWQVRTYDSASHQSDWSDSEFFWSIDTPGSDAGPPPIPDVIATQEVLGCGEYRVFIYEQGGTRVLGELQPLAALAFNRVRDDISTANLVTNGLGDPDCCEFYGSLRCWLHEVVIYRDNIRVWEGPITRITYNVNNVEIEARDVMIYLYRRIMRQGFNDAYRIVARDTDGQITESAGIMPVLERAQLIIMDALAPYDPNLLPYLTVITGPSDAREAQTVPDWAITAWEQVDSLAATAGMDYTALGRRIMLWDTHTPIGRLPALTDGDFSAPPIVSEYGMQLCNFMAVTNGTGLAGSVAVDNPYRPDGTPSTYPYGPIEILASSYSESATATDEVLSPEAVQKLVESLTEQAASNIAGRWPTPLVVRVPDNSSLSPNCAVGFQQLVPGVWVPLRASGTCRTVSQWQKLDSVAVEVSESSERVSVVLSPAPGQGADLDLGDGGE